MVFKILKQLATSFPMYLRVGQKSLSNLEELAFSRTHSIYSWASTNHNVSATIDITG
jgi:hypothetical protein